MKQLTIFTPTYNRAYTLPRLYESLKKQDQSLFLWLIVDDGSTDNTRELVQQWQKEGIVEIRYFYQENAGKMQAHNRGAKECTTELFMCCDSDDWMVENSIAPALDYWNKYKQPSNCGFIGPKKIPKNGYDSLSTLPRKKYNTMAGLYRDGYKGETAIFFRTAVIRKYPFPQIDGEKFITEDYIYCQIDEKYDILVYPAYCMVCEYQPDGYSKNIHTVADCNPKGYALYYNEKAKHVASLSDRYGYVYQYLYYSRKAGYSIIKIFMGCSFPFILCKVIVSVVLHKFKQ